jgi:CPA1 family monovalent cation:H+ antiporter
MDSNNMEGLSPAIVIGAVLAVTFVIIAVRFLWVSGLELIHRDPESGERGIAQFAVTELRSLVTTIAGPKGAVTLSIIMTIPLTMTDGTPFASRDLIIFITSGVILCTLLLANFVLPLLSPIEHDENADKEMTQARILVLEKTVQKMRRVLDHYADADFAPAFRITLMHYRVRLMRERLSIENCGDLLGQMIREVLAVQQARADEIQSDVWHVPETERLAYYSTLPMIRESIGYFDGAENVGSRFETRKGRFLMRLARLNKKAADYDDEQQSRILYDTLIFALDLEHAAIQYLQEIRDSADPQRKQIAEVLIDEHEAALQSLWSRINYGQETKMEEIDEFIHEPHHELPEGMKNTTMDQFRKAIHYNDEADANGLQIELDKIKECRLDGSITAEQAKAMREEIYLMQTALLE